MSCTSSKKDKTVLVHGCWDVLHVGHLYHLMAAKKLGDRLVVSVTPDKYVNKGPHRPYFTAEKRAEMLLALKIVDDVIICDCPTAVQAINKIKPDVYAKGPDYKDKTKDVTGEIYNEEKAVKACGGELAFTEDETFSSSAILNRLFAPWSEEQKATIEKIKSLGGVAQIEEYFDKLRTMSALIIGEPIVDVYRFCRPEGISSKSPTISARFEYEEAYEGGATAIYNHLKTFLPRIAFSTRAVFNPPRKIRYISTDKSQRVFEVTHIKEKDWDLDFLSSEVREDARDLNPEVVIAADFGHGLFEGPVMEELSKIKSFIGLNVQTNSSNFGFNVYQKHKRFDYLCLDTREARLACHDRFSPPKDLCDKIHADINHKILSMTLGPNGSFLKHGGAHILCPAFADSVVDATGAGDAYFAITTCLLAAGAHPDIVPFVGNVYAGLKAKIIGNKASVTRADLLKAINGILK